MNWYLIYTKPRQEERALVNLHAQGFSCYLPQFNQQKMRRGKLVDLMEPLFPRYLFVQLEQGLHAKSWGSIRSTLGVNHLVKFGSEAVRIKQQLIDTLKSYEVKHNRSVSQLFKPGQKVLITEGPFAGIEAVYQMTDGQARVLVLIELLSKPTELVVDVTMVEAV